MARTDIKASTDGVNTLEQTGEAAVGSQPARATGTEPDEYPIDFDEWAAGTSSLYRTHVAGFRNEVRLAGELTTKKQRDVWQAAFRVFCGEAKPEDAPKV